MSVAATQFHAKPILFNVVICGIIGAAFGFSAQAVFAWLIGGMLVGLAFSLVGEWLFSRLGKRRLLVIVLLEALFAIFIVLPLYAARASVYPVRYPISITPAGVGVVYEDVALTTSDGIELAGWYVPAQNGAAVIALHGYNGNRTGVIYHLQVLAEHGYGVLAYDMRGHGESGGQTFTGGWEGRWDVEAAIAFLKAQGVAHIGAIGLSAGAHEILNSLPYTADIEAIIADGMGFNNREDLAPKVPKGLRAYWFILSPLYWMHDRGVEFWSGIPAPPPFRSILPQAAPNSLLFITGDDPYEREIGHEFYLITEAAELWELPDTPHIGGILKHHDEYVERMLAFFDARLEPT